MSYIKFLLVTAFAFTLAACGGVQHETPVDPRAHASEVADLYSINRINIEVPRTLRVSEEDRYYPNADIVWRGEPIGDRYAQVEAIFRDGFANAASLLNGRQNAIVDVEVTRFHAVTERTRARIGGTYSIAFNLQLRDARTGAVIQPARVVKADLRAPGGAEALANDAAGRTQRVVLVQHLGGVLLAELAKGGAI